MDGDRQRGAFVMILVLATAGTPWRIVMGWTAVVSSAGRRSRRGLKIVLRGCRRRGRGDPEGVRPDDGGPGKGEKEKELADMYFFETLVRIHREGEGARTPA